ncbi:hypothetical protein RchiOBHm_Chr3g0462131 [Rosa chinensis]|uniref:Uncharacterized protein n=1 Tax=Rosa chinensis TaxID=74649 RepID=A0A2P6R8W2_ROSCH|nr:hypothetical protein RchiOBHm_Chr6g0296931 [Rosa chinensis]PRQ42852.1 hypothetical protein RchiOBHm_Chr3g0462131 [Rosa chinensis]
MTTGRPITNGLTFETLYRPSFYVTCLGPDELSNCSSANISGNRPNYLLSGKL